MVLCWMVFWFSLPRDLFPETYSTVVYDRNMHLIGARVAKDEQWRFPPAKELSEKYIRCLTEYEDRYFYKHPGVNPGALFRAIRQNIRQKKIVSGGSTISMQVIRLSRQKNRTFFEKIIECILALRLEMRYSKQEILLLYASHAPFGSNIVGIDAATWRYLGHSSNHLSWGEAALLAVLPNAPSAMHISKNRQTLLNKRNRLLEKLYQKQILDQTTYTLAKEEPLPDELHPLPSSAPHLVSQLNLSKHGQRVQTSIQLDIQKKSEQIVKKWQQEFSQTNIHHIATMIVDVPRGEVISYCGNIHDKPSQAGNQVDIIQADRSSGSILKPFLYQQMLQAGEILPNTLVSDIPIVTQGFNPQNFNQRYDGVVPASQALSRSLNIPSVNLLKQHSVAKFLKELRDMGLKSLYHSADYYGLSLILGGAEVRLWDLCRAYLKMAQSVLFYENKQVKIETLDWGNFERFSEKDAQIFQAGSVWQTFEALIHVNRPEEMNWQSIPSMSKIAWKTGTSYGFRDGWAVGITPHHIVGVWVGNAGGEGAAGLTGTNTAARVMFDLFNLFPNVAWFPKPDRAFQTVEVCRHSGCLAGRYCEIIDTIDILPEGLSSSPCPYHTLVHLNADETYSVLSQCYPAAQMVHKKWFVLPPAQEWYYKKQHPEYRNIPPLMPGCKQGLQGRASMEFIYPNDFRNIKIPRKLDGQKSEIVFELAHREEEAIIYWHLDQNYIGQTQYFHQMNMLPEEGTHTITVVDQWGNSLSRAFRVEDP